ncbi:MAG: DUF3732 domain-containing protein [Nitrospira sp.]|nr:MAG: DUF3732 domain-containing protein [Nitrospira sp.]
MYFQIKELILWPKNRSFQPRRLRFQLGKVNVITGAFRTGKSAVIPIIDYCLASGACGIPVQTIRDACSWFGVIVVTEKGETLLARREPGEQRSTDDMFMQEARTIQEVPRDIAKNIGPDGVKRVIDEMCGLSNLDFSAGESQSGFDARPSFRDLSAFVFQPQNVVANPDVLFFKADTYEHREKLRKIFPYILHAITPALLAKQYELSRLQRELSRKEREFKEAEQVSAQWMAELRAKMTEARELGLTSSLSVGELSRDEMIHVLQGIVGRTDLELGVSSVTISESIRELSQLENEETEISQTLTGLRRRLIEMNRIRESASNYHDALRIQRDRLELADWLIRHREGNEQCPVCGGGFESSSETLQQLHTSLKGIEVDAGDMADVPAAFDRELQRVEEEVNQTAERLKAIRVRRDALVGRSGEARSRQYQVRKAERFIGNLENALALYKRLGGDAEMRSEMAALRSRVQGLQAELRAEDIEGRKRRALQNINANAGRVLSGLDAERPDAPISLEINDLTIKVIGQDREDLLSEIGSGSNWLAYHIAVMLGLQQFFLSQDHTPVPSFLIMDQPSQVYFPKKAAVRPDEQIEEPVLERDEDIEAVRKAFTVMGKMVGASNGKFQIIVLDHADSSVWGGLPNVEQVEEWRGGSALVPLAWLQA